MTPDDTMSSAADMSGSYLAAAIHPLLLSAFTDGGAADNSSGAASTDTENTADKKNQSADNTSDTTETDNTANAPVYTDSSANDFGDGSDDSLIREKMIPRSYRRHQLHHWMTIPHILILIIRKVIRILQTVMSHFIRSWMRIRFHLQEVVQRMIHMYICAAVQKKR